MKIIFERGRIKVRYSPVGQECARALIDRAWLHRKSSRLRAGRVAASRAHVTRPPRANDDSKVRAEHASTDRLRFTIFFHLRTEERIRDNWRQEAKKSFEIFFPSERFAFHARSNGWMQGEGGERVIRA